jgi:hypothetical protein
MISRLLRATADGFDAIEAKATGFAKTKMAWVLFTLAIVAITLFVAGWLISSIFTNPLVAAATFAGLPVMMLIQLVWGILRK